MVLHRRMKNKKKLPRQLLTLTHEQLAVTQSQDPVNVVIAGAGVGKTYLLVAIAEANPDKTILMLAFSRKAVQEMQDRLSQRNIKNVEVRTINGFGRKIIRAYYEEAGYKNRPKHLSHTKESEFIKKQFEQKFNNSNIDKENKKILLKILRQSVRHDLNIQTAIRNKHPELEKYQSKLIDLKKASGKTKTQNQAQHFATNCTVPKGC